MNHNEVFKQLKESFPMHAGQTELWFPNGKNSIRIRLKNREEFIFSCDDSRKKISLETVASYLAGKKGAILEK